MWVPDRPVWLTRDNFYINLGYLSVNISKNTYSSTTAICVLYFSYFTLVIPLSTRYQMPGNHFLIDFTNLAFISEPKCVCAEYLTGMTSFAPRDSPAGMVWHSWPWLWFQRCPCQALKLYLEFCTYNTMIIRACWQLNCELYKNENYTCVHWGRRVFPESSKMLTIWLTFNKYLMTIWIKLWNEWTTS